MATLGNRQGVRYLQWEEPDGRRKTVGLGRMPAKAAGSVRAHVDQILVARAANQPVPPETARWLGGLEGKLRRKLEDAGLVAGAGERPVTQLGPFLQGYIGRRTDLKPRSVLNLDQARASLVGFFGSDKVIGAVTRADAADWRRAAAENYAGPTVAAFVKKARQMFADAVDRRLIADNPFAKLKAGSFVNSARNAYVPRADVLRVIEHCPDAEWKLAFALARFAGCRVPSEIEAMEWGHWHGGRLTVLSPKTEHHEGRDRRVVPVSDELGAVMIEAYERAAEGERYMLPRLRGWKNLRVTAVRRVEAAGLAPWPRVWQNLRASCETDWAALVPIHVAAKWSGNTALVAVKHYLSVTEQDWAKATAERAARGAADSGRQPATGGDSGSENAVPALTDAPTVPPAGVDPPAESPEILQVTHLALRRALRSHARTLRRLKGGRP